MKAFFIDLFDYNHECNNQIITILNENDKIPDTAVRLSSHILNAHQIWNHRIQPGGQPFKPWDLHSIQHLHGINEKNHEDSTLILETLDLDQNIGYTLSSGQGFTNTVRDLLFHVINHSTYHRAQIATAFRQSEIYPLMTDYIVYKMKPPK